MSLALASKLGPYEVTATLGAGGMGEVYRARDTKLGRDVAIKVLPAEFAQDSERLARFEREARLLASLNHPGIAHVYGFETASLADGAIVHFLAMEMVEGEDLAQRLTRGAVPVDEAIGIARQIAEGIEEAHEHGVIHRDLKPANIKLTPEGKVKILDFGLAKAYLADSAASGTSDISHSPTMTKGTEAGMILGTAVDKRADIWAFGVVVFEILTGKRLFAGETVSDILVAVLTHEPNWSALPAPTPPRLRALLKRCLDRDMKMRLRDIGEARVEIARIEAGARDSAPSAAPTPTSTTRERRLSALALTLGVALIASLFAWATRRPAPTIGPTVRFDLAWPGGPGSSLDSEYFYLSPDGSTLAIVADGRLWLRALDSVEPRAVPGADGASYPFWSPDGKWIAFLAGEELRRIGREGGKAQKICDAPRARGGAWSTRGTIVFADRGGDEGLSSVEDRGGKPVALPRVPHAGRPGGHRYPQFLPDGRHFIFTYLTGSDDTAGIYVGDLDGAPPVRVLDGSDHAAFAPGTVPTESGYLVFRREKVLMAQAFDATRLRVAGEMFPVAEGVGASVHSHHGAFAVSAKGVLAHSARSVDREVLTWLDRSGRRIGTASGRLHPRGFEVSPDARTIAYAGEGPSDTTDIWLQATGGGSPSRFTFNSGRVGWAFPFWSHDGSELVYATEDLAGQAQYEILRRRFDRAGPEETLAVEPGAVYPWDLSPSGRELVYSVSRDYDLWLLSIEKGAKATALAAAPGTKCCAQFSPPDGRFIAYAAAGAGQSQVFVQPVPATGALFQVSTKGGGMPRWRGDGKELFYRGVGGELMAVPVRQGPGAFDFGTPQPLFDGIPSSETAAFFTYQPARDGQRFLVPVMDAESRSPITVVLNWQSEIRR